MELNEHCLLDELEALRREINWELAMPTEINDLISTANAWNFDCSDSSSLPFSLPIDHQDFGYLLAGEDDYSFSGGQFTAAPSTGDSMSYTTFETTPGGFGRCPVMEEEDEIPNLEVLGSCKMEPAYSPEIAPVFNAGGTCDFGQKIVGSASKKLQGKPSKNLMAERRRRKRLNDRLSMLRSIVPKISKMDRTAILADSIDYVKELLEKINHLQREIEMANPSKLESTGILRAENPSEYLVRNAPKFNVERREGDTRIEICCAAKPGLLLSTVHTLEALGLDIQQCVISCFNDFAIQASCSEGTERRPVEEVKQELFENAGYGGRCL
ncbi:transcription factor bHLH93-like isoform X1 [Cucurbita moschata]|uniref:Transcription factor bHLH93-like isoform X1 n=1 Tax=Cucurbita moschata TaxID=3662 RepID=A0A6J1FIJ3_CUCMO|nr:transcription factor bHLH93-like isoform X1 [Cucurbita moschata]